VAVAVLTAACSVAVDPAQTPHRAAVEPRTTHPSTPPGERSAAATENVLRRQADTVQRRDLAGYLADWDPSPTGQRLAARTYANLVHLDVATITPRLDLASIRGSATRWTATVGIEWLLAGIDRTASTSSLRYTFVGGSHGPVISRIEPVARGRTPVWLLQHLQVSRGTRTLVVGTTAAATARVDRLLRKAVTSVAAVLPGWHGRLVAYAPATAAQFADLIGARPTDYDDIAAVTTVVDGSQRASAPTAIVVNPRVFAGLDPVGARVVITHEATHQATDAAAVSMPLWLAEGFADYVALGSVGLPVGVAAKAALHDVRRRGAPAALPSDADFAVGQGDLEATYERAWLATSLIAQRYGQHRLVSLYRTVEAHPDDVAAAFTAILHTTVATFTASWRRHLEMVAASDG
jgi:hypothetical protein